MISIESHNKQFNKKINEPPFRIQSMVLRSPNINGLRKLRRRTSKINEPSNSNDPLPDFQLSSRAQCLEPNSLQYRTLHRIPANALLRDI